MAGSNVWIRQSFLKLIQMFEIFLLFSWQTFWSNSTGPRFIFICFGNVVLSCTWRTVHHLHRFPAYPIGLWPFCLSTLWFPTCFTLYTHAAFILPTALKQRHACLAILNLLRSHLPLALYPLDICSPRFSADTRFSLSPGYLCQVNGDTSGMIGFRINNQFESWCKLQFVGNFFNLLFFSLTFFFIN